MGSQLKPEQIPPNAPVIPTTASSFREIREGQVFGLVCKKCGKIQYRRFRRKNIFIYVKMLCISCEQSERQTKYRIDKENPVLVTTSDEVAGLPLNQPFKFICKRCEKEIIIKCAGERAASRFTGYCTNCYQSVFRSKTIDGYITMTCPEDFDRYYSRHQKFIIKCKKCGKMQKHEYFNYKYIHKYKSMLCTSCMRSEAMTGNKNGIIEGCHDPVMIEKPEDFDKLTTRKPYFYYCASCGKLQFVKSFDRRKIDSNKVMLCENCSKSRIYYDGQRFDSLWEVALWIYARDHNEVIIREPIKYHFTFKGTNRTVNPDFLYKDKIIEIKGDQYFEDGDSSKRMVHPYNKKKINGEYIEFNDEEKKYYDDLYEAKRQCEMSHGVEIWSENECLPYIQYVEETYGKSFLPKLRLESIKKRNEIVSQI